ncbi:MAG: helix-turn-helix domain-containing protein [Pseudomonadota bacterium]|nr:helix-turn-helix domain-containing protein [Pseudomonadota bacterium]
MVLDSVSCYLAVKTHDPRFDGRFFTGVTSTRIYCRPVCPAKVPKRENCRFFPSAAAAESEGFRPCLRCRPELAPGNANIDAGARLAQAAASLIEDGAVNGAGLEELANRLGVTDRHLRRVFFAAFGVAPIEFVQTQRLLLAKRLLTDTKMSTTDIAFASGFQSLRRFNSLFKDRYRLAPSDLRKRAGASTLADEFVFELAYRPPLDWQHLLAFLGSRGIAGVEVIDSKNYRRTVRLEAKGAVHRGWISVSQHKSKAVLRIHLSASLAAVLPRVMSRIKHLFDLSCHPAEISAALGGLAVGQSGIRLPGAFEGFELAVRAVLGQQITVRAATTMAGRFAKAFGDDVATPFAELTRTFPAADQIASRTVDDIARLGIIAARARTILALARHMESGELRLDSSADVEATITRLRAIPGIGDWTAQYIAMRALAWPDAFPHTDYGVMKALAEKNPRKVLERAEAWRPWRAYAVMHLWRSLE